MAGTVKFDRWLDSNGVVVTTPINYAYRTWNSEFTTTSTSLVEVTNSAFTYTPKRADSLLLIVSEVSINVNGTSPIGASHAIYVNGTNISRPDAGHEIYCPTTDLYVGRVVKTHHYTVANLNAITIKAYVRSYNGNSVRWNQGSQWDSYIHVWELLK